jgi:hypothetical protein
LLVIQEVRFMLDWLNRNEPVRRDFAGKQLYAALSRALADDVMDAHEEDELVDLLLRFIGGTPSDETAAASYSTSLPLDDPAPKVATPGAAFCFTGKFQLGSRQTCERAVAEHGGLVHKYPCFQTCYLVIGELGSRDWIHSNSGRKIERAVKIRSEGHPLKLICEQHWCGGLAAGAGIATSRFSSGPATVPDVAIQLIGTELGLPPSRSSSPARSKKSTAGRSES